MFLKSCIGILILAACCSARGPDVIEGCNELPNRDPKKFDRFNVSDFEHNGGKFLEVFRLKMVFKGEKPVMGLSFNETNFIFGPYKVYFGIYDNFDNFKNETKPSFIRGTKRAFSMDTYTKMEVLLTKGMKTNFVCIIVHFI